MGLKLYEANEERVTRNVQMIWRDNLIKFCHCLKFNDHMVKQLKNGLELGHLLKLPFELSCNHKHLVDFLAVENKVRPFYQLT